ncbi:MAG: hypothetical protein DRJ10_03770, partial [Bacteroidetes bacterium]
IPKIKKTKDHRFLCLKNPKTDINNPKIKTINIAETNKIFRPKPTGNIWEDRLVDLRIADHENPIKELGRLLKVHRAYEHMNNGDLAMEHGNSELANKEYSAANKLMPESEEMKFWQAVTLANENKMDEALKLFKIIFRKNQNWKILTPRIADAKLLNVSKKDMERIMKCNE